MADTKRGNGEEGKVLRTLLHPPPRLCGQHRPLELLGLGYPGIGDGE